MKIKPPPMNEPLRLDPTGRITSVAWVQWLQALVSSSDSTETLIDASEVNATTTSSSTAGDTPIISDWSSYDDAAYPSAMIASSNSDSLDAATFPFQMDLQTSTTLDSAASPFHAELVPQSTTSTLVNSSEDILTLYWMGV